MKWFAKPQASPDVESFFVQHCGSGRHPGQWYKVKKKERGLQRGTRIYSFVSFAPFPPFSKASWATKTCVNHQFHHFIKKTNHFGLLSCNLFIQVINLSVWVSFINFTNSLQLSTLQFVLVLVGEYTGLCKSLIPRKRTMRNEQFYSPSWAFSFLLEISDLAHSCVNTLRG